MDIWNGILVLMGLIMSYVLGYVFGYYRAMDTLSTPDFSETYSSFPKTLEEAVAQGRSGPSLEGMPYYDRSK